MNIQKVGDFSFTGNMKVCDKPVQVKEASSELQDKEISIKVDISKEGLEALRKKVQEMPGHIDFEKEMQFREILPKLQMDPAGSLYSEMRSEWQAELDDIKAYNGSYDLEDIISATMKSYAKQYHGLVQGHAAGSRDIYVSDSLEEYHKVELEEDLGYLDKAFERATSGTVMYAGMQEQKWAFRHFFYGEPALDVELPQDYRDRIKEVMQKAQEEFHQQYKNGTFASEEEMIAKAGSIGSQMLREDEVFYNKMAHLFKPLDWAQ